MNSSNWYQQWFWAACLSLAISSCAKPSSRSVSEDLAPIPRTISTSKTPSKSKTLKPKVASPKGVLQTIFRVSPSGGFEREGQRYDTDNKYASKWVLKVEPKTPLSTTLKALHREFPKEAGVDVIDATSGKQLVPPNDSNLDLFTELQGARRQDVVLLWGEPYDTAGFTSPPGTFRKNNLQGALAGKAHAYIYESRWQIAEGQGFWHLWFGFGDSHNGRELIAAAFQKEKSWDDYPALASTLNDRGVAAIRKPNRLVGYWEETSHEEVESKAQTGLSCGNKAKNDLARFSREFASHIKGTLTNEHWMCSGMQDEDWLVCGSSGDHDNSDFRLIFKKSRSEPKTFGHLKLWAVARTYSASSDLQWEVQIRLVVATARKLDKQSCARRRQTP